MAILDEMTIFLNCALWILIVLCWYTLIVNWRIRKELQKKEKEFEDLCLKLNLAIKKNQWDLTDKIIGLNIKAISNKHDIN